MDINKHILSLEGPILVLGASGFIGANLFKMLLSKRDDVYGVCRLEKGWRLDDVDSKNIFHMVLTLLKIVMKLYTRQIFYL